MGLKLNSKLMTMPFLFQISCRIQDLNVFYGRNRVLQEFRGDSGTEDESLQIHVDNLYGTYSVKLINEAVDIIFASETEKVSA